MLKMIFQFLLDGWKDVLFCYDGVPSSNSWLSTGKRRYNPIKPIRLDLAVRIAACWR